jgi:hypothetical protein
MRLKLLALLLSLSIAAIGAEFALSHFVERIKVRSELFVGHKYPVASSFYLPFTLPSDVEYHHRSKEFNATYRINKYGYRGTYPQQIEKPVGRRRVLVCGDSFTLGWGVQEHETFVHRLNAVCEPQRTEVINAGYHAGYSPDSYYAYLVREGMTLQPDVVIVAIYTGNDITDMRDNRWGEVDERGGPTVVSTNRMYTDYRGQMILAREHRDLLLTWNYRVPFLNESHLFVGTSNLFNRILGISAGQVQHGYIPGRPHGERLPAETGWERFGIATDAIALYCEESGVPVTFVLISPPPWRKRPSDGFDYRRMKETLLKRHRTVLSMKPFLPAEAYFANDGHCNSYGHQLLAQHLSDLLYQQHDMATFETETRY